MSTRRLRWAGGVFGVLCAAGFLGVGASAWACFPQPLITLQPRASGPAGTEVTVEALAINGAAEVRWNSSKGEKLATATGPSFSTMVKVPDVPVGVYSVVVLERRPDGSQGGTGLAAFEVLGPGGSPAPPAFGNTSGEGSATGGESSEGSSAPSLPVTVAAAAATGLLAGGVGAALASRRRPKHRTEPPVADA